METYSVQLLNPKVVRILESLVDLGLVALQLQTQETGQQPNVDSIIPYGNDIQK